MCSTVVCQKDQFLIRVNRTPAIGGFRGAAGSLQIVHAKPFTQLNKTELMVLAACIHNIVQTYSSIKIEDVLVSAKESKGSGLKLNLTPYPKCNLWEKIQGFIHYFFGGKTITDDQYRKVINFWKTQFENESILNKLELFKPSQSKRVDHFCNPAVIQRQLVAEYGCKSWDSPEIIPKGNDDLAASGKYALLIDKKPQGNHHTLVINQGDKGHVEQSILLFHRLVIVQEQLIKFQTKGDEGLHYVERFGNKLRSVPHTHSHAIGLLKEPRTFVEKIVCLFRSLFPSTLSEAQLAAKVLEYRQ